MKKTLAGRGLAVLILQWRQVPAIIVPQAFPHRQYPYFCRWLFYSLSNHFGKLHKY
jgi:hypothetical protein